MLIRGGWGCSKFARAIYSCQILLFTNLEPFRVSQWHEWSNTGIFWETQTLLNKGTTVQLFGKLALPRWCYRLWACDQFSQPVAYLSFKTRNVAVLLKGNPCYFQISPKNFTGDFYRYLHYVWQFGQFIIYFPYVAILLNAKY